MSECRPKKMGFCRWLAEHPQMPFVTTLRLSSGDRAVLESVVADIKAAASRKGAQFKGPHPEPPRELSVPQYVDLAPGETAEPWSYTVYSRVVEIVGHDDFARTVAERDFPDSVHVSASIDQVRSASG
jgi:small subunit ribosomal protein S10